MLRRLRLKFILTNMLLVTVVLLAVFGALMISTAQQLERESAAAMKLALRQDGIPPQLELHLPDQGGAREWRWAIPVFCVTIEADGTLTLEEGSQVKVTEDTLAQAVQEIQEAQAPSGTLQNLGLRFQQEQLSDGRVRIAFSDLSWERASLGQLMVNSLLIGGTALAVFFAISLFLARLSLKPVERAWTQQRQFVADASHELKTPLTVILANTGIMAAHPDATVASQRKWLGYIQEEAQRMKELVEDMLFLAKHDGAERPKDSRTVNFSDLVTGCVLRFESVAFERQVELNSHIPPGLSLSGEPGSPGTEWPGCLPASDQIQTGVPIGLPAPAAPPGPRQPLVIAADPLPSPAAPCQLGDGQFQLQHRDLLQGQDPLLLLPLDLGQGLLPALLCHVIPSFFPSILCFLTGEGSQRSLRQIRVGRPSCNLPRGGPMRTSAPTHMVPSLRRGAPWGSRRPQEAGGPVCRPYGVSSTSTVGSAKSGAEVKPHQRQFL